MKRVIFIVLALVVAVSIMVIPAFAAESYTFVGEKLEDNNVPFYLGEALPPAGKYTLTLNSYDGIFVSEPFYFEPVYFEEGGYSGYVVDLDLTFSDLDASLHLSGGYVPDLTLQPSFTFNELGYNSLSMFPSITFTPVDEPINLLDYIGNRIFTVIQWIGTVISELVVSDGSLHGLLPLLAVGISVSALVLVIKVVKSFIWGS